MIGVPPFGLASHTDDPASRDIQGMDSVNAVNGVDEATMPDLEFHGVTSTDGSGGSSADFDRACPPGSIKERQALPHLTSNIVAVLDTAGVAVPTG